MIYDCFLFFNEFEILDIRLNELYDVVDKFVLVESTVTHINKPKPLYYLNNKKKFKDFQKKIIHIVVRDSPNVSLAWIINGYQFSQMAKGLKDCHDDDTILFGDLDEIPKSEKIADWKDKPGNLKVFEQTLFYYFINNAEYSKGPWFGTHMTTYKHLLKLGSTWVAKYTKADVTIPNGGWHFSYMGGVKKIQDKISNMTHQEFNLDKYNSPERIQRAIIDGRDIVDLGYTFRKVDMSYLPEYVVKNQMRFKDMILKTQPKRDVLYKIKVMLWELMHLMRIAVLRKIKRWNRFLMIGW